MKFGIRKDVDWEYLGAVLAKTDDVEQVSFFKAFVKECKSWETSYQVGMQLASINLKLTEDERETLSMLGTSDPF